MYPAQCVTDKKCIVGFDSGIAFCSKIRIATENTIMMVPETNMGHFTDSSTSYFLSRLKNNYGRYIALCAASMTVEDIMYAIDIVV